MPGPHLPDKLRERAISLFEGGKGYKSISRELGLSRDVVRGWIQTYKTTGRREYVCKNGSGNKCLEQLRAGVIARYRDEGADEIELEKRVRRKQERAEEKYKEAREAYENGDDSLFKVAEQFGLKYNSFREFLLRFHPESRIVHSYNRQRKELIREIQAQVEMTARLSKIYQKKIDDYFSSQMAKIQAAGELTLKRMSEEMEREVNKVKIKTEW